MQVKIFFGAIIAFILVCSSFQKLTQSSVEIAINCGGEEYKSKSGVIYKKDQYFEGGKTSDFGSSLTIGLTKDGELYKTERWSDSDFSYKLPVSKNGKYTLVLKFSEVYFNSPNEKVFDVSIGDKVILRDIDIFSKVGKAAAFDEFIEFELRDKKVFVEDKEAKNGYDGGKVIVKFIKKEKDNPKINAILIVKGNKDNTDYAEYITEINEIEKKKIAHENEEREFKRVSKSIDFEDFEDDFVDDGRSYSQNNAIFSLRSIVFISLICGLTYYIFFSKEKH